MFLSDQRPFVVTLPTVTGISPASGPETGGTVVTITGANFTGATSVSFGGVPAFGFTVLSDTQIAVSSPPVSMSGVVDVMVSTPSGTSATSSGDKFTFLGPPTVTSVSPTSGPAGGGNTVTIDGTSFLAATALKFGTTAATTFTVISFSSITATAPAGTGTVDVTVTTPLGTSATSSADQYTYTATAPGAPTGLGVSSLGVGQATLEWTAPSSNGGSAITSYTVTITDTTTSTTLTPIVVSGSPPATSTPIAGLTAGDYYSFAVSATNAIGTGPASSLFTKLLPAPFWAVAPARICDTRPGNTTQCAGKTIGAGGIITLQVTGQGGVPAGATAVVANVTVTGPTAASYLTLWPAGAVRPVVSNLNFTPKETVANLVTVPLSSAGVLDLYNASGSVNVIVDVTGYYGPGTGGQGFTPLTPARICDTRPGNTTQCAGKTLGAGGIITLQVTGQGGVPSGATAVVANVTVTKPTATSYLTAWQAGASKPFASALNFTAGETVPNRVIVPLSSSGALDLFNAYGDADVILDVNGYFAPAASGYFEPVMPVRICDTRSGNSTPCTGKTLGSGSTLTVQVSGNGGVPTGAAAVVANVTVTGATAASFLTIWPAGTARPLASDLNFTAGATVPNLVVAELSPSGAVDDYNGEGTANLIFDVGGWYTP